MDGQLNIKNQVKITTDLSDLDSYECHAWCPTQSETV